MCKEKARKFKTGSQTTRLREARRQRRGLAPSSSDVTASEPAPHRPHIDINEEHTRVLNDLNVRTAVLMQKSQDIQEQIADLKRETAEFLASVYSNPDNRRRCLENIRVLIELNKQQDQNQNVKVEPDVQVERKHKV